MDVDFAAAPFTSTTSWTAFDWDVGTADDWTDVDLNFSSDWLSSDGTSRVNQNEAPSQRSPAPRQARVRVRSSLACLPCRSRHIKCDARKPVCSRCEDLERQCSYTASKRGKTRTADAVHLSKSSELGRDDVSAIDERQNLTLPANHVAPSHGSRHIEHDRLVLDSPNPLPHTIELYYKYFHRAHPFVLPKRYLQAKQITGDTEVQTLLDTMRCVGSLYSPAHRGEVRLNQLADAALALEWDFENGYGVQALMMLAVTVHAHKEFVRARQILNRAIEVALQLEMNTASFASQYSNGCKVLEESWRRTWWYLYITDGNLAGINNDRGFQLDRVLVDMRLPCEDALYESGNIPQPRTLDEYNDCDLVAETDPGFSSFAYLVGLAHVYGPILAVRPDISDPLEPEVMDAETKLTNWWMYLPENKRSLSNTEDGEIDQLMFQSQFIAHTLRIKLHRPMSSLRYSAAELQSKCTPPPRTEALEEKQRALDFHTTKVLEAAQAGINLFTLPISFIFHTPLLLCGLSLCLLAQMAACRFNLRDQAHSSGRHRIRLGMSVVKALGTIWPLGMSTLDEVKIIARDVLRVNDARDERAGRQRLWLDVLDYERLREDL